MYDIREEHCIVCNGSGKSQKFDSNLNRWVASDVPCDVCKGVGYRVYSVFINGTDFLRKKVYISSLQEEK